VRRQFAPSLPRRRKPAAGAKDSWQAFQQTAHPEGSHNGRGGQLIRIKSATPCNKAGAQAGGRSHRLRRLGSECETLSFRAPARNLSASTSRDPSPAYRDDTLSNPRAPAHLHTHSRTGNWAFLINRNCLRVGTPNLRGGLRQAEISNDFELLMASIG
jgi:hypothetical protein